MPCRQRQPLQNFTLLSQSLSHSSGAGAEIEMQFRGAADMKRFVIWSGSILLLAVVGIIVVRAEDPRGQRWVARGWGDHGPLGYVAHQLNLSDVQRSQIKAMWQVERPTIALLVQELAAESREMDTTTAQEDPDERKVQAIAARQGEMIAKLLVEKEHFKLRVYTDVLNPEQRTKADEFQKNWHSRLDRVAARIGSGDGTESHN
jgi:Spy/CpxP family protein refolding chaperone